MVIWAINSQRSSRRGVPPGRRVRPRDHLAPTAPARLGQRVTSVTRFAMIRPKPVRRIARSRSHGSRRPTSSRHRRTCWREAHGTGNRSRSSGPTAGWSSSPEVDAAPRSYRLHNEDLAPGPDREADLDHLQLRGAVGRHGPQHPDVDAGRGPGRDRDGLVPGDLHDHARQRHRADPDAGEQPRRAPSTASRSRSSPGPRSASSGPTCRRCIRAGRRLRLVRHPDLDRRRRDLSRRDRRELLGADSCWINGRHVSRSASATRPSRGPCG